MKKRKYILVGATCGALMLLLSLTAMACHNGGQNTPVADAVAVETKEDATQPASESMWRITQEDEAWADSVMSTLSERERVAQLFVPRLDITNNAAGIEKMRQVIEKEKMGGLLLGKGSIETYVDLNNRAQEMAAIPVMVTLDGEWGLAMRVPGTPRFPHNMCLGAANDEALMYRYGKDMARQCKLMGIQVNFAPVMDVNSNPANPVIGYRSFGEDPVMVGKLATAYSRGMAEGGVLPVGKHFPGHGDTSVDSHKSLPTVSHSQAKIDSVDIVPFAMSFAQGMPSVMVGHLNVPALDASGTPSSLSYKITTEYLQDSLGFDGLIFTDALAMKGADSRAGNNCVRAFKAGADLLLGSGAPVADLQAMLTALKAGEITQAEVDKRCKKVLAYKHSLGLDKKPHAELKDMRSRLMSDETNSLISEMAQRAITLLWDKKANIPMNLKSTGDSITVVSIGLPKDNELASAINKKNYAVTKTEVLPPAALQAVKSAKTTVVIVGSDAAWAKTAFEKVVAASQNSVGVFMCNPYKMVAHTSFDKLTTLMIAYDDIPQLRQAVVNALAGKADITGRMPVNPGSKVVKMGDGIMLQAK